MPDPRIHVDFNGIQEDGRIFALRRHADVPAAVVPGASVQLWDEDGDTVQGRVVALSERDLVEIEVLEESWQPGEPPEEFPAAAVSLVRTFRRPDMFRAGLTAAYENIDVMYTLTGTSGERVVVVLEVKGPRSETSEGYIGVQSAAVGAAPASNR